MEEEVKSEGKLTDIRLRMYGLLVDQLQKYNSIIWQAPTALVVANILALEKLVGHPILLLCVWIFNWAFIIAFYRTVTRQKTIITTTRRAESALRQEQGFSDFIPDFGTSSTWSIGAPRLLALILIFVNALPLIHCVFKHIRDLCH
jgi:hypothetical protein